MIVVVGDLKALFSKGQGSTPFSGLLHFSLDTYLIKLSVKVSTNIFGSLVGLDIGLNTGHPSHW